jgi:hypothetical protein
MLMCGCNNTGMGAEQPTYRIEIKSSHTGQQYRYEIIATAMGLPWVVRSGNICPTEGEAREEAASVLRCLLDEAAK